MKAFLVKVACVAHLQACPIPQGHQEVYKAHSKTECEHTVKTVIAAFGYPSSKFTVSCEEH